MAKFTVGGREFGSQDEFIAGGRRCATPRLNDFEKARIRAHLRTARANGMDADSAPAIRVPVHFHVIHDGNDGKLSDDQVNKQIQVLNDCFSPHGITFELASLGRTSNAVWFRMTMGSAAERKAKTKLGKDTDSALNLYTARIGAGLLGWATFPADLAGDPARDGVVILDRSLPGGDAPYDLGMTTVHEVGHWLGLYHTFENGCMLPGDEVDDTALEASPNFGPANPTRDTCPNDGKNDPTTNFMDYTDDAGMNEFTAGQVKRMREQVLLYRPLLLGPEDALHDHARGSALGVDMETGDF